MYENIGHTNILAYTDAEWADSPSDRRSTLGYCVLIRGNLIKWKSKKRNVVARSCVEVGYLVMAFTT